MIDVAKKQNKGLENGSFACWLNAAVQALLTTPLHTMLEGIHKYMLFACILLSSNYCIAMMPTKYTPIQKAFSCLTMNWKEV